MLWLLGGVSKLKGEPADADSERRIAIAGPATSVALAVGFFVLSRYSAPGIPPAWRPRCSAGWAGSTACWPRSTSCPPSPSTAGGSCDRSCGVAMVTSGRPPATAARTGTAFGYGMMAVGTVTFFATGAGLNGFAGHGRLRLGLGLPRRGRRVDRTEELRGLRVRDLCLPTRSPCPPG